MDFLLKIGQDLIDFVVTILSDSKISHRKSQVKVGSNTISNEIWLKVDLVALAYFHGHKSGLEKSFTSFDLVIEDIPNTLKN